MTTICLVAALDRRRAIGRDNDLPWRLPDDLKRFKAVTLGHPVLMGRRTAESLGRALPKRLNLVLTRADRAPFDGMQVVHSLQHGIDAADGGELMVIGGGQVFEQMLPQAGRMYLTHVDTEVDGADAFFPPFDPDDWEVLSREHHPADARHAFPFEFVDYRRRREG